MLAMLKPAIRSVTTSTGLVLTADTVCGTPARCVGDWLTRWARTTPDAPFLAERDATGMWATTSYADALSSVEGIAAGLLDLGATPARPVLILSDNSVDSALLMLGAMHAGIPVSPVSSAYALVSTSFARLKDVAAQLAPKFVFVDDRARFERALAALDINDVIVLDRAELHALAHRQASVAGVRAFANLTANTIAKVLFTSGSTGSPKGVVNTQRMLTANQESLASCWPFLAHTPPVVVDWLPWSHTFGGNHNFNLVLRNGGALYIDKGRPAPGLIETTLHNMADVGPNLWFNVPRGFDVAVGHLESDPVLAARVLRHVDLVFFAAAALSPTTRTRLESVATQVGKRDVFFTSSWGSTETSPLATSAHFTTHTTGILGVPVPGVSVKLAPVQDRLEIRVKGDNVTPGTWCAGGGITPVVLDDDGYLPTGDAGRLHDATDVNAGIVFEGRLSENFKLSSGTWVSVAGVRIAVVDACAPLLLDVVVAGHDRTALGALLFLSPKARELSLDDVRAQLHDALRAHNRRHGSSSERIARALVVLEPLSLDDGETTDKGYTNQRRVLARRSVDVERLFAEPAPGDVLVLDA